MCFIELKRICDDSFFSLLFIFEYIINTVFYKIN